MTNDGGTVRYHRAEYRPDDEPYVWRVWFTPTDWMTFDGPQGEAMGLTPQPAPLVVTCNGHSIELSDEDAERFIFNALDIVPGTVTDRLAHLLRDARQDPQPASATVSGHVEPMDDPYKRPPAVQPASREPFFNLAHPDFETQTWDAQPEQDDTPGIDFDALPIGTVAAVWTNDDVRCLAVKHGRSRYWYIGDDRSVNISAQRDVRIVFQPSVLSPGECLRGLLAGRDDADELIEYAAEWWDRPPERQRPRFTLMHAVGVAAREVHG